MNAISRRNFLKTIGLGTGAIMVSNIELLRAGAGAGQKSSISILPDIFNISHEDVRKILSSALSKGGDFSELFFEYRISNSLVMEEDIIKNSSESISLGVGIRVLKGSQIGYAFTNEIIPEKITQAALTAAAIAKGASKLRVADLNTRTFPTKAYESSNLLSDLTIKPKIDMVSEAYQAALKFDSRITKVTASLNDELQCIAIANSEGLLVTDFRPMAGLYVSSNAESNGVKNTGFYHAGGRVGADFYKSQITPAEAGNRASNEAVILLEAKNPPPGEQVVVLSKDQSGVMIHEAVGHPLEADANWKKSSIMWDKMNQMVANPIVTIYDDATIPDYRGSLNFDDEGTPTESVPLIEKGKLIGYLNDRISAKILGHKPNGHGRRQSYQSPPIPRMNNTILAKGDSDPDEIIASVKKGFYAVTYQGGMVNDTGKFTFSVNLGYMIENGKLTHPVKNATLIGTNIQILKEVSMIGNDTGFFLGTCGKDGQSVPVTAGTPTLKINKMTVGGIA